MTTRNREVEAQLASEYMAAHPDVTETEAITALRKAQHEQRKKAIHAAWVDSRTE